jgi:hypothetical protein
VTDSQLWKDAVAQLAAGLTEELQSQVGALTAEDAPALAALADSALRWAQLSQAGHPHAERNLIHVEAKVAQILGGRAVDSAASLNSRLMKGAMFGATLLSGFLTTAVNRLVGVQVLPLISEDPVA